MAGESTNYGIKLQKGTGVGPITYADIADVTNVKPPAKESAGAIETTNHNSNGVREYIGSGLVGLSEFSITVNYKASDTLAAEVDKLGHYRIIFTNELQWTFDAVMLSFAPNEADSTNPDRLEAEISFQPSGACVIEPVAG